MRVSRNETYKAIVYKRLENSNAYEEAPSFEFNCRVANDFDKNTFVPTNGLYTESSGVLLYASDIPFEINIHDKIVFLGKEHLVESVGYYLRKNRLVNASISSDDKILEESPKGVQLG